MDGAENGLETMAVTAAAVQSWKEIFCCNVVNLPDTARGDETHLLLLCELDILAQADIDIVDVVGSTVVVLGERVLRGCRMVQRELSSGLADANGILGVLMSDMDRERA